MPKIVPKSIQTLFEHVLGQTFRKLFAQFSMECRVFENFQRKFFSKFQKSPKVFSKVSKRVLNMFWGKFFDKFLPSFPWNVESSKIFKKIYFQNSKNAQKCSQKYPNVFYCDFFEKNFMPGVPWNVESSKIFEKILFQNSKNAQNCSQKYPKVF